MNQPLRRAVDDDGGEEEDDRDSAAEDDDACGAEEAHICDPISVAKAVFTTLRTTLPAMLAARHTLTLCNAWRFIALNPKPPRCSASSQSRGDVRRSKVIKPKCLGFRV